MFDVSPAWLLQGGANDHPARGEAKTASPVPSAVPPPPVNVLVNHPALAQTRGFVDRPLLVKIIRDEIREWAKTERGDGKDVLFLKSPG